ncbi:MAG: Uma2 family endonuclease [Richelia sp. CSU_2_1]|nr:Uma2 family endonuclease [Richelia sp. CSU_2_1]
MTFDEFITWYPNESTVKYELRDKQVIEIPRGSGDRSLVVGNIRSEIQIKLRRLCLPYSIPGSCLVKIPGKDTGYQPDIVVLDRSAMSSESRWLESSIILNPGSIQLAIELTDENWETSYLWKKIDYEEMGVAEYWIADYQNKVKFEGDGNDGFPKLFVCNLTNGAYHTKIFSGDEAIESVVFPCFNLTVNQLFRQKP